MHSLTTSTLFLLERRVVTAESRKGRQLRLSIKTLRFTTLSLNCGNLSIAKVEQSKYLQTLGKPDSSEKILHSIMYVNKFFYYMFCAGCERIMQAHKHEKAINMKN